MTNWLKQKNIQRDIFYRTMFVLALLLRFFALFSFDDTYFDHMASSCYSRSKQWFGKRDKEFLLPTHLIQLQFLNSQWWLIVWVTITITSFVCYKLLRGWIYQWRRYTQDGEKENRKNMCVCVLGKIFWLIAETWQCRFEMIRHFSYPCFSDCHDHRIIHLNDGYIQAWEKEKELVEVSIRKDFIRFPFLLIFPINRDKDDEQFHQ